MEQVSLFASFFAGIVSFLSPCVLPLVPGYVSYMSGISLDELSKGTDQKFALKKSGWSSVFFVLGFSLVFTLMGASASVIGRFLADHLLLFSKIAGVAIILFGLHTIGILRLNWLYYEKRLDTQKISPGLLGSFLMGLAFAFGWTPCIGPMLAGILALAATQETLARGTFLLFVYSMGLGIPFVLTGFATHLFLRFFNRYKRFIRWGEIVAGILLIFVGGLVFTNKLTSLLQFMPEWLYKFAL